MSIEKEKTRQIRLGATGFGLVLGLVLGLVICLAVCLVPGSWGNALAHSTKGRIKIPLDKKTLEIDDIAYFVEAYVHRELYKDKYEKPDNRFYVNQFHRIDQDGRKAVIHFRTLDFKEKSKFEDQITIHRSDNGIWEIRQPGAENRELYTYVKKTGYYYQKYVLPISCAGVFVFGAGFLLLRIRNRRQDRQHANIPDSTAD